MGAAESWLKQGRFYRRVVTNIAAALVVGTLGLFSSSASSAAFDIHTAFSHPDAPDARQISGLTVYHGILVVPTSNGVVKLYFPGIQSKPWSTYPTNDLVEHAEGINGLTIFEQDCAELNVYELDMIATRAEAFFQTEKGLFRIPGISSLFGTLSSTLLDETSLVTGYGSYGCLQAWSHRTRLKDTLSWQSPEGRGSFTLRDGANGVLDGLIARNEGIRGIEFTTTDQGDFMLLTATDEAVYSVQFGHDGPVLQSQALNHPPEFVVPFSASCVAGQGPVSLDVLTYDTDGDMVTVTQVDSRAGYDGSTITQPCSTVGSYTWSFAANDGKTDDEAAPVQTYTVTVSDKPNSPPVWKSFSLKGLEDTPGTIPQAMDPDGDTITYCMWSCDPQAPPPPPVYIPITIHAHGSYTTDPNWCGTALPFSVAASDGTTETVVTATFEITCDNSDKYFFSAETTGTGLWKTDGTAVGTRPVKVFPYSSLGFGNITLAGNVVYFTAASPQHPELLWKSDGTEAGTVVVKEINPAGWSGATFFTDVDGTLYFNAEDGSHGPELWKSDGTEAGTVMVKDINPGPWEDGCPCELTNVRGTLFFNKNDGLHGYELWKTDGTESGTVMVRDIDPAPGGPPWGAADGNPWKLTAVGNKLFFAAEDRVGNRELWVSDGTEAGTTMVKEINPTSTGSWPNDLVDVNGFLFFQADDGVHGRELWRSDGTVAGTFMVKDINPTGDSWPYEITNVNGVAFFRADDGVLGEELWKSDGTEAGTILVKDIVPGAAAYPGDLVAVGDNLYFTAPTVPPEFGLWKTDGTEGGTVLVTDYFASKYDPSFPSSPNKEFVCLNDTLLFTWGDFLLEELWKSDGTDSGTVLLKDFRP